MKIPYYSPSRRSLTFSLLLLLAFVLLVLTGLGVFRLYFGFDWTAGADNSGELFSLKIRGGNAFNLFESEPFGQVFWVTQLITVALALVLPWFRIIGGSLLTLAAVAAIAVLHLNFSPAVPSIPLEFQMLILFVLFSIYVLLSYMAEIRDRKHFASLLSQYVPPELAAEYSRNPESLGLSGEEREISVLFCDTVGFSAISEQLEPQQLAAWLNGFFSMVSRIVVRYRGTIDKYMGDSVMAVWGAPAPSDTHAYDAMRAAMDIRDELGELNRQFREQGLPEIAVGIGVSTGRAMVGPLGSEYRMDYTVVGDSVNVAQRLEAQTRKYAVPIIVGDKTAEAMPELLFRELDTVIVKGRKTPVTMFEPLGLASEADEKTELRLKLHREAMLASKAGKWGRATELFTELREEWGPASMYDIYLRGIEQASAAGD